MLSTAAQPLVPPMHRDAYEDDLGMVRRYSDCLREIELDSMENRNKLREFLLSRVSQKGLVYTWESWAQTGTANYPS